MMSKSIVACCISPGVESRGRRSLSVSTDGVIFGTPMTRIHTMGQAYTGVYPNKAPATGGTEIRLTG